MEVDSIRKEAEDYNLAGNCAFKDKEYEKAIRFYNYVLWLYGWFICRLLINVQMKQDSLQIVQLLIWVWEIVQELCLMQRKWLRWIERGIKDTQEKRQYCFMYENIKIVLKCVK